MAILRSFASRTDGILSLQAALKAMCLRAGGTFCRVDGRR
jgi:hypothetical protein